MSLRSDGVHDQSESLSTITGMRITFCSQDPPESVGQVILRIGPTAAATGDDRVDDSAEPTGIWMPDEQSALAADRRGTDSILHGALVDLEATIAEICCPSVLLVNEVVHGLAQTTLTRQCMVQFLRPSS